MTTDFSFLAKLKWMVDSSPLDKADVATKKLEKDTTKLGKESKKTEKDAKNLAKGIDNIEKSAKKSKDAMAKLGNGAINLGKSFAKATIGAALAGAAIAAAAVSATAVAMVNTNKETTAENKKARSVGFTAEQYAQLGGAVKSLGFEQEKVIDMADEMNKVLSETKSDPKKLKEFNNQLKDLGINFESFSQLNPGEKLKTLFDAAASSKNPEKVLAIIDKIFKGDATKIVTALKETGTSLAQLALKQKALSFETEKSRKDAELFTKSLDKLTGQLDSIKSYAFGTLGAKLVPILESISTYIENNKEVIRVQLGEWIDKVVGAAEKLWVYFKDEKNQKAMKETFESIANAVVIIAENIGPITKVVGALLSLAVLAPIVQSLTALFRLIIAAGGGGAAASAVGGAAAAAGAGAAGARGVAAAGAGAAAARGGAAAIGGAAVGGVASIGGGVGIGAILGLMPYEKPIMGYLKDTVKKSWSDFTHAAEEEAIKSISEGISSRATTPNIPIISIPKVPEITLPKAPQVVNPTKQSKPKTFEDYAPPEMKSYFEFPVVTPKQISPSPIGTQTSGKIPVATNIYNDKSSDTYITNNEFTINANTTKDFNAQELKRIVVAELNDKTGTLFQSRSKRT